MTYDLGDILLLQGEMETTVQRIINQYIGENKTIVNVRITMKDKQYRKYYYTQEKNKKNNTPVQSVQSTDENLPGYSILNPKSNAYDSTMVISKEQSEVFMAKEIGKIDVILIVDKEVNKKEIETLKYIVYEVLKLNTNRGDKISVILLDLQKTNMLSQSFPRRLSSTLKSQELIKFYVTFTAIFILAIIILILSYVFIQRILRHVQTRQQVIMQEQSESKKTEGTTEEEEIEELLPVGGTIEQKQINMRVENVQQQDSLFGFINEGNLSKVAYLLKDATLQQKIAVMNFLRPELAAQLLESLPLKDQKNLVLNFSNEAILSRKEVESFSKEIKSQIDFLAGGRNFTFTMFDYLNNEITQNIISAVQEENKELASEISENIYVFKDIRFIEKRYVQYIVKKLGIKDFSIAISTSDEEFQTKIFGSLSEGMAELLKQSLRLLQKQPRTKILEEQHRIVQILRSLNREGLIPSKGELIREQEEAVVMQPDQTEGKVMEEKTVKEKPRKRKETKAKAVKEKVNSDQVVQETATVDDLEPEMDL